jgi:hypothetical protein
VQLEPASFDAHNLKAIICIERGELRTAAEHYNQMGPMRPASIEVVRLRLMLYLRMNQLANAQEHAPALLEFPKLKSRRTIVSQSAAAARRRRTRLSPGSDSHRGCSRVAVLSAADSPRAGGHRLARRGGAVVSLRRVASSRAAAGSTRSPRRARRT